MKRKAKGMAFFDADKAEKGKKLAGLVSCCFPKCKNVGKTSLTFTKGRKMSLRYRMYKVNVEPSNMSYENRISNWLPRIGLCERDIENLDDFIYLCDGHFSLRQYSKSALANKIRLKSVAVPDVLQPNPPPTLFRAISKMEKGESVSLNTDLRNSQMIGVPTNYNVKVTSDDTKSTNELSDSLKIIVRYKVCCLCALPVDDHETISLIDDVAENCTEFGRLLSFITSLTETPILSAYACKMCAEVVTACFNRIVEINSKIIVAPRRLDDCLCIGELPAELPCHACADVLQTSEQYKEHLILHILKKNSISSKNAKLLENLEEGEVYNDEEEADGNAEQLHIRVDHSYHSCDKSDGYTVPEDSADGGMQLCDVCGTDVESDKFNQHKASHKRKTMLNMTVECPVCSKIVSKSTLQAHVKRHDENFIEPISKQQRKSSFTAKTSFFTCQICNEKLKTLEERDTHKADVHGIKKKRNTPQCYHCDYRGRSTAYLKNHLKKMHPDKIVARCEDCNKDFYHENALLIHNSLKHPELHKTYMEQKKKLLLTSAAVQMEKKRAKLEARLNAYTTDDVFYTRAVDQPPPSPNPSPVAVDSDSEASQAIMYIDDMGGYYATSQEVQTPDTESVIVPGQWEVPALVDTATDIEDKMQFSNEEPILYESECEQPSQYYEWPADGYDVEAIEAQTGDEIVEYLEPVSEYLVVEGNTVIKYLQYT